MNTVGIIFPHQLFEQPPFTKECKTVYLVEEFLFFKQYRFHKQKILFHRASMKSHEQQLIKYGFKVNYVASKQPESDIRRLIPFLKLRGIKTIVYTDTADNWLEKRIQASATTAKIELKKYDSPMFINTTAEIKSYFHERKKYFQTDFYIQQRKERKILLDTAGKPIGGKWSFDESNRERYPKGKTPPSIKFSEINSFYKEGVDYVRNEFSDYYGEIDLNFLFPCTLSDSKRWLVEFFQHSFSEFGPYEDAIVANERFLHHSLLTPFLNSGLLTPQFVIEEALNFNAINNIPISSLEGFVRQIMGWREFIRGVYESAGNYQRTKNYWKFTRKIPASWWEGNTGILPIDITIKKIINTGYCHHIERLMVLGNFMVLCEFDPDEVYKWFMELFIDSYDWVMVPNVYGMSQFADGGLMSTKPYISGSNYLMKMGDYPKGEWQNIWDALFWRFMHVHRDFFLQNPRLGMLVKTFDKMNIEKRNAHLRTAEKYLSIL